MPLSYLEFDFMNVNILTFLAGLDLQNLPLETPVFLATDIL